MTNRQYIVILLSIWLATLALHDGSWMTLNFMPAIFGVPLLLELKEKGARE